MKLPSIQALTSGLKNVFLRFPFEILSALSGTLSAMYLVDYNFSGFKPVVRILLTSNIALLLFLSGTFISETKNVNKWIIRFAVLILSVLFFFYINPNEYEKDIVFFFIVSIALHLLVSFSPFLSKKSTESFWRFNKSLFLRFLTSALYSGVIFGGLSLAMLAVETLFGIEINDTLYMWLWIVVAGTFNTTFFLAGIPKDFSELEHDHSYPKGLKAFTKFVLLPLVTLYILILLVYEFKIIFLWDLPKGWVSNLIIASGIFGMLSILLVYPIRNDEQNKWIKVFSKSFYYLLLPLVVLMYVAILTRVSEYGFTESRYLVLVVGIWLTFIALYFIFSKKQNIKVVPVSLFIVSIVSALGPLSAFNVSLYSQRSIIKNVFEKNNFFTDGKIIPLTEKDTMSYEDIKKVNESVHYLNETHGVYSLKPLFTENNFDTILEHSRKDYGSLNGDETRWANTEIVMKFLNLKYNDEAFNNSDYTWTENRNNLFNMTGYDFFCSSDYFYVSATFHSGSDSIIVEQKDNNNLIITVNHEVLEMSLDSLMERVHKDQQARKRAEDTTTIENAEAVAVAPMADEPDAGQEMELVVQNKKYRVKVIFKDLSFRVKEAKQYEFDNCNFWLLVKKL